MAPPPAPPSSAQPTTLRDSGLDQVPQGFDIRHAVKFNWIYELPFGQGHKFLLERAIRSFKKVVEGWEISGVVRLQSGTPLFLNGLGTLQQRAEPRRGVVLHNITARQLQSMVGVYKTSLPGPTAGIVYYLPPPDDDLGGGSEQHQQHQPDHQHRWRPSTSAD